MIPAEFDYVAPDTLEDAISALESGGEDAKLLAGGHSLLPLMKLRLAAPSLLVDLRKLPGLHGVQPRERRLADRRDDDSLRARALAELGILRGPPARSPTPRSATGARSAARWRTAIPPSDLPAVLLIAEGTVAVQGSGGRRSIAAGDLFEDYLETSIGAGRGAHRGQRPGARRLRLRLPEVQPPQRGLGDGGGRRASSRRPATSVEDVRVGLTNMGSVPLRASGRRGGACAASR